MPLTKPSRTSQQYTSNPYTTTMSPSPQAGTAYHYPQPQPQPQSQYYPPPSNNNYPPPMGPPPPNGGHSRSPSNGGMYYPPHHTGGNPSHYGPSGPPSGPGPYPPGQPGQPGQQGHYPKQNVTQLEFQQTQAQYTQALQARGLNRTPSPTPSEVKALNPPGHRGLDFWLRKEWIWYYLAAAVLLVIIILFSVYNHQIVEFLQPAADKVKNLTAGWLIFVAILFVISFPPLFGHEIVSPIVGLIYGPGIGFAIVAAGTLLGEIGNFFAFKYCCRARGQKWEREKIQYGALARVVREGGFKVALICRYSAIPPHFTTAVFATCDMKFHIFLAAAVLSLPKQFVEVYVGSVIEQDGTGTGNEKNHLIETIVIIVTIVITVVAMRYIRRLINAAKPAVVYARRKRRQQAALEAAEA